MDLTRTSLVKEDTKEGVKGGDGDDGKEDLKVRTDGNCKTKQDRVKNEIKTEGKNHRRQEEAEAAMSKDNGENFKEEKSKECVKNESKKEVTKVFGEEMKGTEGDEAIGDEGDAPPTLFKKDLVKNTDVSTVIVADGGRD